MHLSMTLLKSHYVRYLSQGYTSRTCVWDGEHLVLPSDSGKLMWWSKTGEKVAEFKAGSADYIVRLEWSVSGRGLWIIGFSSLTRLQVERSDDGESREETVTIMLYHCVCVYYILRMHARSMHLDIIQSIMPSHVLHSHDITCCGVGFNPSGRYLGSGDLAGNVWVTQQETHTPVYQCSVRYSISVFLYNKIRSEYSQYSI